MGSNKLRVGINDLSTWCANNNKTILLKEWDYDKNKTISPSTISYASNNKVWWKCHEGHSYEARIANRVLLNRSCPYCSGNKTLTGFNDFATWCMSNGRNDLLDEWDTAKNAVVPSNISPKNNMKVWWKCKLGHEWEATIGSRSSEARPAGCPYCSNPPKRILVGFNDFESWCIKNQKEYLLKEWNYERNTKTSPKSITYGSGKQVWWRCSKGHEWRVSPSNRAQGTGCPICSRTQTSFPEQAVAFYLAKSFNVIQRYSINGFEIDIFLEDYNIGIEYDGMFYHTEDNFQRESEKNSFYATKGITLIHIKENKTKFGIEDNNLYFIPEKTNYLDKSFNMMLQLLISHIEETTEISIYKDIDVVRDELAIREHYASILKNDSVAIVFPELVREWDVDKNNGMTPECFSANSHTKVWWRCENGHSWQASISSRGRKLGCPYCAGQRTIEGQNDLKTWCLNNNPQLLSEWNAEKNEYNPSEVAKTSNLKVWWKCAKGHEWEAVIANRVHGTRCPFCFSCNYELRGKISLEEWCQTNNQEQLLTEWNRERNGDVSPKTVTKGSHLKVWWKCSAGHEWQAQIKSRTYNHGCPFCSETKKKAQAGINDLATWCKNNNKQYILDEWDYDANVSLKPEMFTYGSHKLIQWKCCNGHKWSAIIKERTKHNGNMCPECRT